MSGLRARLEAGLNHVWYRKSWISNLLLPLAWMVGWEAARRRRQAPPKGATPEGLTVIVVGGITVGGTGKTPVLIALGRALMGAGYRVGVISRGYGAVNLSKPHWVAPDEHPSVTGDEPLLIRRELDVPVVVCRDRAEALEWLVREHPVDVVLSDDGLQHYGLMRDLEIAVVDAERSLGNGRLLPAGPLREPATRLRTVDWCLERNGNNPDSAVRYVITGVRHRQSGALVAPAALNEAFSARSVAAATGLGQPEQFFSMLASQGLAFSRHIYPDHYALTVIDLSRITAEVVLITAKDNTKLREIEDSRLWIVEIEARLPASFVSEVLQRLPAPNPTQD